MAKKPVKKVTKADKVSRIKELASKKGVVIFIDHEETSSAASIDSVYSYDESNKILTIVANKMAELDKELLLEIIRKVHNDGELLLKSTKKELLKSYQAYKVSNKSSNHDEKILNFFETILSRDDFNALKMSLYLRYQDKSNKNINSLKSDIRDRFGDRGGNIANLCSAGYFEEFMELYNQVDIEDFKSYYEMVVGAKARALFVYSKMPIDEIESKVNEMIEKAIKYHMEDFRIHGKGLTNVKNIASFLKNRSPEDDGYVIVKTYENKGIPAVEYIVKITR